MPAERFRRRRHPGDNVITRVEQRFVDTGHVKPTRGMGGRSLRIQHELEQVASMVLAGQTFASVHYQEDATIRDQQRIHV